MREAMITNFRDIGGYEGQGGRLEKGIFFRSGQLVDLNEVQEQFLEDTCKLDKIYDFRNQDEVKKDPDTSLPSVDYVHLDVLADLNDGSSASLEDMFAELGDIEEAMLRTYEEIVLSKSARSSYHKFLLDLIDKKESRIFHCFAGKDRTGWGAYLILKIAGVSEEDILEDYLKTNQARKEANDFIINQYRDQITDEEVAALESALTVKEEYLNHAIKTINDKYGSFENYLLEGLDLPATYEATFKEMYLL
ncbi:tyrosine-protein phosphatase [Streptococcaceae bacterium ESL0729]|nr:tyrosine-protein phosphatase [Streptococcaceae bacterium ESL0729]